MLIGTPASTSIIINTFGYIMNHFNISLVKSLIRIISSFWAMASLSVFVLAAGYAIAEVLGIMEEVYDKREEL
jgi:hypothetical protein|tara:strand:- start:244 stop:462 length:219 start_codon:yes stop_codon:yes gene_type:complete